MLWLDFVWGLGSLGDCFFLLLLIIFLLVCYLEKQQCVMSQYKCGFQLARNICINPEVRVTKQNRAAGVLDNFSEGEKYSEHGLRKLVRNRSPQIMPSINNFFTDPKLN